MNHEPSTFAVTRDGTGGVRCSCGWELETRIGRNGVRRLGMSTVWARYREHWAEGMTTERGTRPKSLGGEPLSATVRPAVSPAGWCHQLTCAGGCGQRAEVPSAVDRWWCARCLATWTKGDQR